MGGRKRDWSDEVKELELISQISGSESFLFIQSNLRVKNKTKQNKKPCIHLRSMHLHMLVWYLSVLITYSAQLLTRLFIGQMYCSVWGDVEGGEIK